MTLNPEKDKIGTFDSNVVGNVMARYGSIYQLADFVERTIPRRGSGEFRTLFVHRVINFLKHLDTVRRKNPWINLPTHTGDAMWFYYRGQVVFQLKPALNYLRLIVPSFAAKRELIDAIHNGRKKGLFSEDMGLSTANVFQWRCRAPELEFLERFVSKLRSDTPQADLNSKTHPRNFRGEIREAVMEIFLQECPYCPGVPTKGRKRHKVTNEFVEFDHIFPHAKGGSNSKFNIQVLCAECNKVNHAGAG
jgi:HNH endonuclease